MTAYLLMFCLSAQQAVQTPSVCAVVLPIESDNPQLAHKLTDAVRMKWGRNADKPGQAVQLTLVLSAIETDPLWPATEPAGTATDVNTVANRLAPAAVDLAVWGTLVAGDGTICLHVRAAELRPQPALVLDATFRASGERAVALLTDQLVAALVGRPTPKPVQADTGPEPPAGELVNVNPGLEQGTGDKPLGWDPVDGLTTHWVQHRGGRERGRVLQMDTRILASQASQWWQRRRDGAPASDAPEPAYSRPPYYDSVGAGAGVHYASDYYPVVPHRQYRISVDVRGPNRGSVGAPKVFVKGYVRVGSARGMRREIWRTYVACRHAESKWRHHWQRFQPREDVRWLRIVLYAHWPADVYYWDNVRLTVEPHATTTRPAPPSP